MAVIPSPQEETLDLFLEAWKAKDIDSTISLWSDDFTQQLLPSSLALPPHSRKEAEMLYPTLMGSLQNWDLQVKNVVNDVGRGTAAVYAASTADTPFPEEKWMMDYAVLITFSNDGRSIRKLEEMVDTSAFHQIFPKLQGHFIEQAQKSRL